uniref:Mediator complex subunit 24 n=1 Tax=Mesocestoides corti TaxID=53468 RepID=A0A5K3G1X7_MESCO
QEPSHFSVVKLTEVGLANLHRISVWWKTITDQLLMMCKTTHTELRKLVADALMLLIKQVITATKPTSLFWNNVVSFSACIEILLLLGHVMWALISVRLANILASSLCV